MDSYFNLITPEIRKELSELNAKNNYGLSKNMLLILIRQHKKARENNDILTMQKIEYRLDDINFHTESGLLSEGKYKEARNSTKEFFKD